MAMRVLILALSVLCAACAAPQAHPFAAEIAAFARADRAAPPPRCQILFVGSSSIRYWGRLSADMRPHPVLNRGFGGATIADVNRAFGVIVAPYRPRAIVFYAGENDVDRGADAEAVTTAFARFMAMKRRALGATPVYFVSLKPSRLRWAQRPVQIEANTAIARMADAAQDLVFVDVASAMLEDGAPRDVYVADGLHMNGDGYAIWTRIVGEALAAPAPSQAPGCD